MENPPPPSNNVGNPTGWQPNKEIPKGKVKGMSSLFGSDSDSGRPQDRPVFAGTIQELGKIGDSDDEDPWIIPDKPSRPKTMMAGEDSWGGVPKSNPSEDSEEQWTAKPTVIIAKTNIKTEYSKKVGINRGKKNTKLLPTVCCCCCCLQNSRESIHGSFQRQALWIGIQKAIFAGQ